MSAYWLFVASGGAAALAVGVLRVARGERWRVVAVLLPVLAIGMAGARVAYVALHPGAPLFGRQGQMLDGALMAIVLAAAAFSRLVGMPPLRALDLLAPGIGVGIAIARLGCLANGCCLGVPTGLPWGVAAPGAEPALQEVPFLGQIAIQPPRLHPSPVYEMLLALAAAGAVLWWERRPARQTKPRRAGASFFAFLLILEAGRVLLAPLRAPDPSSLLPAAATSGMVAALAAAMLLWRMKARPAGRRLAGTWPS